jgi:hypothetical protein
MARLPKNKFIKAILFLVAAIFIYSLVPLAMLYLARDPAPYTNAMAVEKIKARQGPEGSGSQHFEFIVFGDMHAGLFMNDSATLKVVAQMNREDRFKKVPIDFVMAAGDVSFRGSAWDYRIFNRLRSLVKWPVLSGMGNHDTDQAGGPLFRKYIGETDLSFSDRNSYFIALNNEEGDISEAKFAWLEEEFKKSLAYKHRFVIMHKAPLSPYQQSWFRPELNPWAYRFMKMCEAYKADIVFSGHEHMFKEGMHGGVRYITSGGGGNIIHLPASDGAYLHYVVVRVYGDYVDYEVRKVFPPAWEYLLYYLWKDLFYFVKNAVY